MSTSTSVSLSVGDREIAFEAPRGVDDGPGHVVLLMHGSSFNRSIWQSTIDQLARNHRPIALDNPSHGGSSGPAADSADELVDVVKGFHDALGLGEVVLVGHSLGGAVAQRYYTRHPEDVHALGLVSTAPHFGLTPEVIEHWRGDPEAYRAEEMGLIVAPGTHAEVRDALFAVRDSTPREGQLADLRACGDWDNQGAHLEIAVPALLITAEHDVPVIQETSEQWAAALPQGTFASVEQASHMMMVEQPAATAKLLADWVDSLPATR